MFACRSPEFDPLHSRVSQAMSGMTIENLVRTNLLTLPGVAQNQFPSNKGANNGNLMGWPQGPQTFELQ